ncbi:MAG: methyltransferase domain-containing protein, partial [Bacteroidetes bacterium]|nr:methyltransferase domain-containing protein [Bacteroidota bacterium]
MKVPYDKYYLTENLFGKPYPELIEFFSQNPQKGKVLDLGCGQGRDAIALARLGYSVTGIDNSKVGIEQMNQVAQTEKLNLS